MTMGLLDSLVGALGQAQGGGGTTGGSTELISAVVAMLGHDAPGGGLGGLTNQFEQSGLGHVIGSWVSGGTNLPVSAEQLQSVLGGSGALATLGQQSGLGQTDLLQALTRLLPQVVDQFTPNGQVPAGGLGDAASLLGRLLNR
jgi:uncharacterized protein YidB (DUF937 family)